MNEKIEIKSLTYIGTDKVAGGYTALKISRSLGFYSRYGSYSIYCARHMDEPFMEQFKLDVFPEGEEGNCFLTDQEEIELYDYLDEITLSTPFFWKLPMPPFDSLSIIANMNRLTEHYLDISGSGISLGLHWVTELCPGNDFLFYFENLVKYLYKLSKNAELGKTWVPGN